MKAAVFRGAGEPLRLEEVPTPAPGPGEVLVEVAACGVCHTDLHYLDHGVPTFKKPPLILGHEATGVVAALGGRNEVLKEGDRVLLPAVLTCGRCALCRSGRENICARMRMFGNHIDGAFAEYVLAPAREAIPLPPEIPLEEGSVLADAVSTPYHAIKNRAQVKPGETVVVLGCGGVGVSAVQIAAAVGARVIGVDLNPKKLEWALSFGASAVYQGTGERALKDLRQITFGGPDVVIEAIGNPRTIELGYELVRTGGRLCVIGYTDQPASLNPARLMFREITILGSLGCPPVDYRPLIELVRLGKIELKRMVTHRFTLETISEAFAVLKSGESLRAIVVP